MDWCCCLVGWMCLGNLLESCHPVTLMELILHSSSRGVPRWHPVQCQAMSSVCAELWGCLCLLWEEGSGGWPRSLSPAWCLAALDGACLAQTGPFCTGFTPFPDFHLAKTRARIFFFAIPVFSFSPLDVVRQHPWNSCSISKCLLEVLSWHLRAVLSSPLARQVLRNMCC